MYLRWTASGGLAALACALALWPAATTANPGAGWALAARPGISEVRATSATGARLALSCVISKTAAPPRYAITLDGRPHGGRPVKAMLTVGPTHFALDLAPTSGPTTLAWSARTAKDERAFRAIATRIRSSKTPLKLKLGTSVSEFFPADGAKAALGAQALQCPE